MPAPLANISMDRVVTSTKSKGWAKDITGQKFARLTVVRRAGSGPGGQRMWACVCECGADKLAATRDLVSGRLMSCGCYGRSRPGKVKDIQGKRFGKLLAISRDGSEPGRVRWVCLCDCGKTKSIVSNSLIQGNSLSCGCRSRETWKYKVKDIKGQRFGRLLVISQVGLNTKHQMEWLCSCDCGNFKIVEARDLLSGNTRSCICLRTDTLTTIGVTHGQARRSGVSGAYKSWAAMRDRCSNSKNEFWEAYGGRGIKFCSEWEKFEKFFIDLGPRPAGKSLDRIDVNGNYEKANCQWATARQQANNKRIRKNNKTGVEGVCVVGESYYRARATIDGKRVALGCYELSPVGFQAAIEAVQKARLLAAVFL